MGPERVTGEVEMRDATPCEDWIGWPIRHVDLGIAKAPDLERP